MQDIKNQIAAWKHAFSDDQNSIDRCLSDLAWRMAVYISIIEVTRSAPDHEEGGKKLNGMMFDLLWDGFWIPTMLSVRRLVDTHPIDGKRGVCSLRAIVSDAKKYRNQLTRRVYLEDIANLEYDVDSIRKKHRAYILSKPPGKFFSTPRELDEGPSEYCHSEFDWLSGSSSDKRNEADIIREDVFERIERRLKDLEQIAEHATVSYAHAATQFSREGRLLQSFDLNDAKKALQQLVEIAEFVGRWFCNATVANVLAIPQFDQFAHIDRPLFEGNIDDLRVVWQEFSDEAETWHSIDSKSL